MYVNNISHYKNNKTNRENHNVTKSIMYEYMYVSHIAPSGRAMKAAAEELCYLEMPCLHLQCVGKCAKRKK